MRTIRRWLEEGSWDEELIRQERWLNRICWVAVIAAAVLFGPAVCGIIMR